MTRQSPASARGIATTAGGAFAAFYSFYAAAPSALADDGPGSGARVAIVMLIVVAVQPFVPLLSRWPTSRRRMVSAAVVSMGAGSAVMPLAGHWPGMVLLGAGFGGFVVASTAWVKEAAPAELLGNALGLYGFGSAIGGALGAPLGLWLAQTFGIHGVALAGALLAAASLLPARRTAEPEGGASADGGDARGGPPDSAARPRPWGWGDLMGLGAHLLAVTVYASVLSGLSAEPDDRRAWLPVLAAFAIQSALAAGRMIGGRAANRWTSFNVGLLSFALLALGAVGIALSALPAQLLAAGVVVGFASGASQIVALTVLMNRANTAAAVNRASAAWNICFDVGLGLGALAVGVTIAA
ncbi:MFS transporter [Gulosibacter sp. 10]|uniref:MFS transporter n=1 Tax=Gulosibacter sp. 10 TaxID=1255570 RepID=UPI00097ECAE4|nr:MFS transporter [Gulosibacter sp. 10]SJM68720.1 Probable major facilitator family transporter [Gulosibacter sp. 10]